MITLVVIFAGMQLVLAAFQAATRWECSDKDSQTGLALTVVVALLVITFLGLHIFLQYWPLLEALKRERGL